MTSICVIFDLDGTLVDSEGLCNQAFLDLLPQLNETVESLTQRYRGKKLAPILADLEGRLCQKLPDAFELHYRQHVAELFSRELKPMPGVLEMLETTNFPKCIASSGPPLKIRQTLQVSGLAPYFDDNIFSSYEVGSWKPEPGLFQYAANAMGFMPSQCVVVEDSEVGIEAAAAAGMKAFRYVQHGETSSYQIGDEVPFDNMLQLPRLLTQLISNAQPIIQL
ncbi:HAD-IA family hydrolase [Candidatus Methylobacter oryzae]|uniref:HAD-IA family hydrolase n=1 Tax=Candidatus Methylobacter oryzae TaxID=2497749 RepID=A0ABY3CBY1_9GAMM|nr:HAD-IA family hydrolase [Candidatus Methylobacter oryzae]TRW97151.1 HAD-IA family hydrolase [Candidatus Methylobacter oryzae]